MNPLKAYLAVACIGLSAIYVTGRILNTWPISNPLGVLLLLLSYGALQFLSSMWRDQPGMTGEHPRKLMHLGNGAFWCTLPWLFDNPLYPLTVSTLGAAWFVSLRSSKLRKSRQLAMASNVYRSRTSLGDIFFSTAFSITFYISQKNALTYCAAAAILTFSDGIAALVGVHWGRIKIKTPTGPKSLEGAMASYFISWPIFLIASNNLVPDAASLLVTSAVMALAITLVELITPWGVDNLLLPVASWALLHVLETHSGSFAIWIATAMTGVLLGCLLLSRDQPPHPIDSPRITQTGK